MRVPALALALVLVPFTGCLGSDEATPAATPAQDDLDTAAAPPTPTGTAAAPAPNATQPVEMVMPYSWDGTIGRYSCLPSGPGACSDPGVMPGEGDSMQTTEDNVTYFSVEISWTPAAPTTEELAAALFVMTSCGDGCLEWTGSLVEVTGSSPLVIDTPVVMPPGGILGFHVSTMDTCHDAAGAVFTCVNAVEQPFHVEGEMTVAG